MALSLSKLPWYAQLGVFAAMSIVGVGVFYYYYEMPKHAEIAKQDKQLKSLQADLDKARATAKKLPQFKADVSNLEHRLANLRSVLPEEKDAADLLRRLQTVAMQSNLTIMVFKPSPVVTKQVHAEWPITLEFEGTYHNLATFFDRLAKFTRIVNVSALEVKGKDKAAQPNLTISAKCVATTFVLLDKAAIEAAKEKEKEKAKGGRNAQKPAAPAKKVA
jgi:type IV pilus assembly protein PilO